MAQSSQESAFVVLASAVAAWCHGLPAFTCAVLAVGGALIYCVINPDIRARSLAVWVGAYRLLPRIAAALTRYTSWRATGRM
jgi:hypothetical protein